MTPEETLRGLVSELMIEAAASQYGHTTSLLTRAAKALEHLLLPFSNSVCSEFRREYQRSGESMWYGLEASRQELIKEMVSD